MNRRKTRKEIIDYYYEDLKEKFKSGILEKKDTTYIRDYLDDFYSDILKDCKVKIYSSDIDKDFTIELEDLYSHIFYKIDNDRDEYANHKAHNLEKNNEEYDKDDFYKEFDNNLNVDEYIDFDKSVIENLVDYIFDYYWSDEIEKFDNDDIDINYFSFEGLYDIVYKTLIINKEKFDSEKILKTICKKYNLTYDLKNIKDVLADNLGYAVAIDEIMSSLDNEQKQEAYYLVAFEEWKSKKRKNNN